MTVNEPLFPITSSSDNQHSSRIDGSVAILMRTKNRPILLARALNSVICQEYKNWHIYLINDGGDSLPVDELVELNKGDLYNNITVIHNPQSLGMEAASNCGFRLATEEFLVVHDDDDSWHPDFLLETVKFLQNNTNAVAVITNCIVIHEEIQNDIVKQLKTFEWGYWKDNIDITYLLKGNITPPICLLIRMNVAKLIGEFNESLPVLGDWDYNLRLFRVGELKTINKELAYYHHRPNSSNIYGNSVISGVDKHIKYNIEYRNSLVRKALLESQGNYGLLHILLLESENKNKEIIEKLNGLEHKINNNEYKLNNIEYKLNDIKGFLQYLAEISSIMGKVYRKIVKMIKK